MTLSAVFSAVSGVASLVAIIVALRGIRKDRKEAVAEASKKAALEATERAEATATQKQILEEQKKLNKAFERHLDKYDDLRDEVNKVSSRTEEAHRRIDRMEGHIA